MTQGVLHYRAEAVMDTRITGGSAIWRRNRCGRRDNSDLGLRCRFTPRYYSGLGSRCRITPGCGQGRGSGMGNSGCEWWVIRGCRGISHFRC